MVIIMEIIKEKFNYNLLNSHEFLEKNVCFFDIETTGFNRNKEIIYLIGILYYDKKDKNWNIIQLFADELKDEIEVLEKAYRILSTFDLIINYNGNTFDIPFMNHKFKLFDLNYYISKDKSFDIYSIIRKNKHLLNIKDLKLKTVEKYLDINRDDIYTGKDCITFYRNYLLNKDNSLKNKILQHNYDDLYYLPQVLKILDIIKKKKSFEISIDNSKIVFLVDNINISNDFLTIKGTTEDINSRKILYYGNNYNIMMDESGIFEIDLEVNKGLITSEETCLFIYKEDYPIISSCKDKSNYKIPNNIILISVEDKYITSNIKMILELLVEKSIK